MTLTYRFKSNFKIFKYWEISLFFLYWFLVWFHCGWRTHSVWLLFLLNLWRYFLWPRLSLSWFVFCQSLKIMCILLLLETIFYKSWLVLFTLMAFLSSSIFLLIFCLAVLSVVENRDIESLNHVWTGLDLPFRSTSFYVTYFEAPLFDK